MLGYCSTWASKVALVVKNSPANAGDIRDKGSIPGSGRSPGEGHGNPLQYSCLENSMDRAVWQATAHRVAKSQTRLKRLSMHESFIKLSKGDRDMKKVKELRLLHAGCVPGETEALRGRNQPSQQPALC